MISANELAERGTRRALAAPRGAPGARSACTEGSKLRIARSAAGFARYPNGTSCRFTSTTRSDGVDAATSARIER